MPAIFCCARDGGDDRAPLLRGGSAMNWDWFALKETMTPEVFRGGTGDLVILQELPSLEGGERFIRIRIPMVEAEALADAIRAVARGNG